MPEQFLRRFFAARNAMLRRHAGELSRLGLEVGPLALIPEKRTYNYEDEKILKVERLGNRAEITTSRTAGGVIAHRLRYDLILTDGAWRVSDLSVECFICHGTGKFQFHGSDCDGDDTDEPNRCRGCRGTGWVSSKLEIESARRRS